MPARKSSVVRTLSVIPPRSIVRLIRADGHTPLWKAQIGQDFRVGYYSQVNGLKEINLVNADGDYQDTCMREDFEKYFEIVRLSGETNLFGIGKRALGRLLKLRRKRGASP